MAFTFALIGIFILILILAIVWDKFYQKPEIRPEGRAGKQGEKEAVRIIEQVLQEGDILLSNICVCYREKETELDNVIINNRGVFIIEVKNYSGVLVGSEDDYEWTKYKISRGLNIYEKRVRNPMKQVKRQVYILSRYLKCYGIRVWIDGYVLLLNNNSPIHNNMILESSKAIDQAIHRRSQNSLNKKTVAAIKELLM